ncbi:sec-independent protein translocase protein TatB [Sphingomonas metalli]|uniref:Sec-independent protein translocase protein TatB n=1 Tax=Sphingomonas metalli TaxID=1779358 RepID=A0A916WNP0_9SPHN|nr:Sec-independent protein translocase protein TatB [Sphingomonas metalli]GGB18073.1 sec-independent protein translocase protein TatB [Sphingomonas metalli]
MFNIDSSEFLLVAIVALVVIGPKDLPKALRVVGYWVGKARGVSRQFRAGFDQMVREAELEEMEKRWAAENARIMAEHPPAETVPEPAAPAYPSPPVDPVTPAGTATPAHSGTNADPVTPAEPPMPTHDAIEEPVMVEKPQILPATPDVPHRPEGAAS